jgi:hypothetical protein
MLSRWREEFEGACGAATEYVHSEVMLSRWREEFEGAAWSGN